MITRVDAELPDKFPCRLAFLAEAPGDDEMRIGRPLVGPSGRCFDALLRTANLRRSDVWVGNVFDEQLPNNSVSNWCVSLPDARAGGWTGEPPEINGAVLNKEHWKHLERLAGEMADVDPTVIVPLGGTALWALTGMDRIGECRGAVGKADRIAPGVKIVPTFHPAAVLRDWRFFPVVVGDILRAAAEADRGRNIVLPDVRAVLEPTLETLREWEPKLLAADLLSNDIETGWGQITCVGFAPSAHEALVVPFVDLRQPDKSYWRTGEEEVAAVHFVRRILESNVPKLGQNFAAYDVMWYLDRWRIKVRNVREDTRLLHATLYPELPKSLAFMGNTYTDQGAWKTMRPGARAKVKRDD